MVVQLDINSLRQKKEDLLNQQDELINLIKTKHPDFYSWAVKNNIDFRDLSIYAANIATAFTITINSLGTPLASLQFDANSVLNTPKQEVNTLNTNNTNKNNEIKLIEVSELSGLSESQKAVIVYDRYGPIINDVAQKYQLDPKLILATILLESGGNTYAIRHEPQINDASYGLGQILYGTAKLIGFEGTPDDLYNPEINIDLIGKYHRRNMDVYGPNLTPEQLTIAYNAGSPYSSPYPGHLQKFNKWFREARHLIV